MFCVGITAVKMSQPFPFERTVATDLKMSPLRFGVCGDCRCFDRYKIVEVELAEVDGRLDPCRWMSSPSYTNFHGPQPSSTKEIESVLIYISTNIHHRHPTQLLLAYFFTPSRRRVTVDARTKRYLSDAKFNACVRPQVFLSHPPKRRDFVILLCICLKLTNNALIYTKTLLP